MYHDNKQQYHVGETSDTNLNASAMTTVRFMFIIKNYQNKFIQKCFFSKPNIFCIELPVIEINCPSGLTNSNAKKEKKEEKKTISIKMSFKSSGLRIRNLNQNVFLFCNKKIDIYICHLTKIK
jgi:hypothetical protein